MISKLTRTLHHRHCLRLDELSPPVLPGLGGKSNTGTVGKHDEEMVRRIFPPFDDGIGRSRTAEAGRWGTTMKPLVSS